VGQRNTHTNSLKNRSLCHRIAYRQADVRSAMALADDLLAASALTLAPHNASVVIALSTGEGAALEERLERILIIAIFHAKD